ncbi:MAG: phosphoglycerate mutase [Betaproteobacteria bacterium]|nr:phosphoglycerate mutase [Betaproteobacteria bacterium]
MHCHLLIPGLSSSFFPATPDSLQVLQLPALNALLVRGKQDSCTSGDWMGWLCREFGLEKQHDWPIAALTLLAENDNPASGFWLLADPVHLQLQRDRMVLMDADGLGITNDEAAELIATLNSHFASDDLIFSFVRPDRWHIRLLSLPRIETCPLEAVIGKNIREFLPNGPDGKFWHRTLNEIQMLLHDHPVNVAREQRGDLPINSIWPWGGGVLPDKTTPPYTKVWAEDTLAIGLAISSGTPHAKQPEIAAEWLQHAAVPGQHLIFLNSLRNAALHGDVHRWRENLLKLETEWFAPLYHALSRGRLTRLSLTISENNCVRTFSATRADLWKFWRRKKPFMIFSGASST